MSAPKKARSQRVKKRAFHRRRHHGAPAEVPRPFSAEFRRFLAGHTFGRLLTGRG